MQNQVVDFLLFRQNLWSISTQACD